MHVAIVGGGMSGAAIADACRDMGHTTMLLSRSTGVDVTEPRSASRLVELAREMTGTVDVFVEATGTDATSRKAAVSFFTASTRTVSEAANSVGAQHILLSIVGCDRPEVSKFGYYAGKSEQESQARRISNLLTVVRTTQWFEFAEHVAARTTFGALSLVPNMVLRPLALDTAARTIAETISDDISPTGLGAPRMVQVAGPEVLLLRDMVRELPKRPRRVAAMSVPTSWGRAFQHGALLPDEDALIRGPTFAEWLTTRPTEEDD